MSEPTVTCIKVNNLRQLGCPSLVEWKSRSDKNLYIGRHVQYVEGAEASKWKNPFPVKKYGLEQSLKLYENHIRAKTQLWNSLFELEGTNLGCWCDVKDRDTEACHAQVLRRLYIENHIK